MLAACALVGVHVVEPSALSGSLQIQRAGQEAGHLRSRHRAAGTEGVSDGAASGDALLGEPEDLVGELVCGDVAEHGECDAGGEGPVDAGNSAVVVDLPRCGPMLSPRVPNLVPIPGITGSARCALRPLEGPRDHRVAPPTRCAAPPDRPTRVHRLRPELARSDRGRARATEPSRVAGHPRHAVASAAAPHRRALDTTTATAGPAVDVS